MEKIKLCCDLARTYFWLWRATGHDRYRTKGLVALRRAEKLFKVQNDTTELYNLGQVKWAA